MAQKNFTIDDEILASFEEFCAARGLAQGRVATAALLQFMEQDADRRDAALTRLHELEKQRGGAAQQKTAASGRRGTSRDKR